MNILGIQWGDTASACLVKDGKIIAASSEERYSRKKNDMQFPIQSIEYCKSFCKTVDFVALDSLRSDYLTKLTNMYSISVDEMVRMQHYYYYPLLYENKKIDFMEATKHLQVLDQYPSDYWRKVDKKKIETFTKDRTEIVSKFLNIDKSKIINIEHHLCHTSYGYYSSKFYDSPALILAIDGSGDAGLNATISIAEKGKIQRIYQTTNCIVGKIYSFTTLILGMRRLEHEYKVMGLAPYGMKKDYSKIYNAFSECLDLDGYKFILKKKPKDSYFYFKEKFEGIRFDVIAAGLQKWTEDIIYKWVNNSIKQTKIKNVVMVGGVSMNVKAMGNLLNNTNLKKLWVPGASNDESLCAGAALSYFYDTQKKKRHKELKSLYLGYDTDVEEKNFINKLKKNKSFKIYPYSHKKAASLISKSYVFGRCVGKMEFGARALGNRSIVADPRNFEMVKKINDMIKNRDFWMPFAPSIVENFAKKYLKNYKKSSSYHMTIAYNTTEEGKRLLPAACHPSDETTRAQIVSKDSSYEYYKLIIEFYKITNVGALLNTSFNLHGYPIVRTLDDALYVLNNSGLNGLLTKNYIIVKNQ